jgi:predicted transcriptional regulator
MELTKAEEQIMQILWKIEKGFIKDILEHYKKPKPAYTTIATILKIMDKKGFVSYKTYGNTYQYYPLITKKEYSKKQLNKVFSKHFENSIEDVVTYFADNNKVNVSDIDAAIKALEEIKEKKS